MTLNHDPSKQRISTALLAMPAIVVGLLLFSFEARAESWKLSEEKLIGEIKNSSPELLRIKSLEAESRYRTFDFEKKFRLESISEAEYKDSSEKAIASFIPTFGPTYFLSTGVQKRLKSGMSLNASLFVDQQSTTDGVIDQATRTGVVFNFSADLWKNILGRLDKAELKDIHLNHKRNQLQSEIDRRSAELNLRKTYWSLVANNEKLKAAKGLLRTAEKQLQAGVKRQGQYIADKGEIARYKAQVESRKASIDSFEYERDLLIRDIKAQVPSLSQKQIVLDVYDAPAKINEVLVCARRLEAERQTPWQNTKWDEIINLIEKSYEQKKKVTNTYSDIDLQLESQLRVSGVDQGYSDSADDFTNNGKLGGFVGLKLKIPLDDVTEKAQQAREEAEKNAFLSEKKNYLARVEAQHTQIVALVKLLQSALKNLDANSENLSKSLQSSQQKFRQARISLNDLISDQDVLFNNHITEIDTKLQVILTLLEYFKVFTEDPCSVNKMGSEA